MSKIKLTQKEVLEYIKQIDYKQYSEIVKEYAAHTSRDYNEEMRKLASSDLQDKLAALNINDCFPKCFSGNNVIKSGIRNGIQY